jgi:23S rRNA-/tRNA-specific pseudouridylate synthase
MSEVIDTFAASVCEDKIDILYQDEHILLISKPSGWQFSYASICSDTSKASSTSIPKYLTVL